MDRRYSQAKGASKAGLQRSEAITSRTQARNRSAGHAAKQYGGQPKGRQSIQGKASSQPILQNRNAEALERSQTFKSQQMGNQFDRNFKSRANLYNAGQRQNIYK